MRRAILAALALVLLAGCGGGSSASGGLTGSRLDPPFTVSPTALTDTSGQPYSLEAGFQSAGAPPI